MSMTEWAKREVEIASKRERGDKPESEWDYGCACYDSALKAFESLCGDGHSGFSIGITKGILNRLIDGKPLTPIEDIEDVWNVCSRGENGGVVTYQCKRMSSLFKDVYPDGTVKYHDNDRYYCIKWDDPNLCWHNGFIGKIYSEMFPLRANAELCLLGVRGKPKRMDAGVHSVIMSHIEEHSKKPAETRDRIVKLMAGGGAT